MSKVVYKSVYEVCRLEELYPSGWWGKCWLWPSTFYTSFECAHDLIWPVVKRRLTKKKGGADQEMHERVVACFQHRFGHKRSDVTWTRRRTSKTKVDSSVRKGGWESALPQCDYLFGQRCAENQAVLLKSLSQPHMRHRSLPTKHQRSHSKIAAKDASSVDVGALIQPHITVTTHTYIIPLIIIYFFLLWCESR